ncbi:MAG: MurR/RpiR family transcriptional regulator [Acidimicrobiales bacterium]
MSELRTRLRNGFASLPRKQQDVARLLADDDTFVSFASISTVAARAGVDKATVVRTCQRLGFAGWTELQAALRRSVAARPTLAERVARLSGDEADVVAGVAGQTIGNLEQTFEDLDRDAFDELVSRLAGAQLAVVAGGGASEAAALYLTSSLQVIGHRAQLVTGAIDGAPVLAGLGPEDLVLAISAWRYLKSTLELLAWARDHGIPTGCITDSAVAPGALEADVTLVASTRSAGPRISLTATVGLIEALIAAVALADHERSVAASERVDELYRRRVVTGES